MTLTFGGAARAGAADSKSGEVRVVDDGSSTASLASTLARLSRLFHIASTATTTATSAAAFEIIEVLLSLEAEQVGVGVGLDGVGVSSFDSVVDCLDGGFLGISGRNLFGDLLLLAQLLRLDGQTL